MSHSAVSPLATAPDFLSFWGKAQPRLNAPAAYPPSHPVAYHLLDVAAAAQAILAARQISRQRAGHLLGMASNDASALLVALIALHDLGKFAPAFQVKAPDLWPEILGVRDSTRVRPGRHTDDGHVLWGRGLGALARQRVWPHGLIALEALAPAIFGHHGRPVGNTYQPSEREVFGAALGPAIACAEALLALLMPVPLEARDLSDERARLATWWVAGLTSVADWVGSNQRWFRYTPPFAADPSLAGYWQQAQESARNAVRAAGLEPPAVAPRRSFAELAGGKSPTPVQQWAGEVELPEGPALFLIEDATGAGKTEAAQMLVHRLMVAGHATGVYWAMPTQATANAMYARQADSLEALFAPPARGVRASLVLAHGQQRLHDRFRATVLDGVADGFAARDPQSGRDDELPSTAACAAFLADDSRAALLADVGAGTVDQALLGVLPSKYNAIRLFGLADKAVVVDEAHAYDAYIGVEVQELLRFQAALGGSAIVLSATLSRKQREQMAAAWVEGLDGGRRRGGLFRAPEPLTRSVAYPLATVVSRSAESVREQALEAASWSRRDVGVRLVHNLDDALEHVVRAARAGGAVAWVRNTVGDCLEAARLLAERGVEPIVFHARFAQGDRQRREREVLALFGKDASPDDRRGRVLVATQVIEQSLDLDFDAMVSDIAPIDFLVQRAGRLQRHAWRDQSRPRDLVRELVVLSPAFTTDPPDDWLSGVFKPTTYVYANAGVLWRTVRALHEAGAIRAPVGLRGLIGQVYDSDETPSSLLPVVARAEGKESAYAAAANYATLKVADGYDASAHGWVSELRSQTRLGDQQTTVRLARVLADGTLAPWVEADGPAWKAWALSEVRVSARKVPPGSAAEARYGAAVARVRGMWGTWEREIPIVPLERSDSAGWRATIELHQGSPVVVGYTDAEGLAFREEAR